MELSENFRRADYNLIGVLSARETMVVKRAVKAALTINSCIAGNGSPNSDRSVSDVTEKLSGNSSAKAALRKGFADIGNENTFKKDVTHCVLAG